MIEIRHLRYFVVVAEELNFRRAAERIHIDQTPLSRTVRDLENLWGVTLFIRAPRSLQLTPAGTKLLEHARKLLVRLERTKRVVRATDARHREPLLIGIDESSMQPAMAVCLSRWGKLAPDIPFEFTEVSVVEMLAALRGETMDAALSFGVPKEDGIAQHPAWTSPLVAIVSLEHELANLESVSLADLLSFPAVGCSKAHHRGLYLQMKEILRQRNVYPTIVSEARTMSGYLMRVAAGQGVGIADANQVRAMLRSDIVVVPLVERVELTTYVLYKHRNDGPSENLQRFLTHATALC